ncbi:hypothetical protein BD779DRAFT_1577915, partial [Infundibulicybe gibba]
MVFFFYPFLSIFSSLFPSLTSPWCCQWDFGYRYRFPFWEGAYHWMLVDNVHCLVASFGFWVGGAVRETIRRVYTYSYTPCSGFERI